MPTRHGISKRSFCTTGSIWLPRKSCAEEICLATVNGRSRRPCRVQSPRLQKVTKTWCLTLDQSQRTQLRTQTSHLDTAREIRNTTFCCTKFQSALISSETHEPFFSTPTPKAGPHKHEHHNDDLLSGAKLVAGNGGSCDDIGLTHGVTMEREMVRGSLAGRVGRDAASGAATPYKWQLSHQSRPAT